VDSAFVTIDGKSKNYKLVIGVLAALTLIGLICFVFSYIQGHQVFGSSNVIPWGMPIVLAIYLIGLSAGSLILSSLTYVFGREEYRPIARVAVLLAVVLIFGALIAIAVDLGRPEKFWRLFMFFYLNNMTSMFAINGVLYGGYFVISLVYMGIILAGQKKLSKYMGTIAVCWAVLVHMGTGAIFGFIYAREAWFSPVKPFEFLAAAVTSGLALLIVVTVLTLKFTGRDIKKELITSLGGMLKAFIIVLIILIFVDKLTHVYAPHREAALFMLGGPFSWIFWAFQIGLVAVVPLIILFNPRVNKTIKWLFIAAISVVVGVFFERYYLVIPGAAYPQHFYPGEIQGVYGSVGQFSLMPAEIGLSIGIFTMLALLFMIGLKYLEALPPREVIEQAKDEQSEVQEQGETAEQSEVPEQSEVSEESNPPAAEDN
jgi:molybdopterin-containing oxidoreductase family membrane subunit